MRVMLHNWMTRAGFLCSIAENGNTAKTIIEVNCPDVLITDIEMPFFNGLELVCWMRQNIKESISTLPIVVITSLEDPELERIICEVGTSFVLRKPLSENEFLRTVREAIASSKNRSHCSFKDAAGFKLLDCPTPLRRMAQNALGQDFKKHDNTP